MWGMHKAIKSDENVIKKNKEQMTTIFSLSLVILVNVQIWLYTVQQTSRSLSRKVSVHKSEIL
jgi:hypothetical protein